MLSEIFHRIEAAVENENYGNLCCSPNLIQIDGRRLPLGKFTYFKDVVILVDGVDEVICQNYKKVFVNVCICSGKVLLPSSFIA